MPFANGFARIIKKGEKDMAVNNVTTQTNDVYSVYSSVNSNKKAEKEETKKEEQAVVYDRSDSAQEKKPTYSINKMSAKDRDSLVQQLKQDQADRQQSLLKIVHQMMTGQAKASVIASDDKDAIWKFIASGKYEVDEATRKQAQEDISEDGYWGVKQTAQRMFDFASALAGDDVETMKQMQKSVLKGFKQAEKAWGGELPDISKQTLEETDRLFEEYYKSKEIA